MKCRNPKYRDTTAFRPSCGGYATLAQKYAVHVTPRAVYVLKAGGGGRCVELPSILAASPRRGNCPTLDSIQGQQDPQTAVADKQLSADTLYFLATGL
jgi:hypothetical protein